MSCYQNEYHVVHLRNSTFFGCAHARPTYYHDNDCYANGNSKDFKKILSDMCQEYGGFDCRGYTCILPVSNTSSWNERCVDAGGYYGYGKAEYDSVQAARDVVENSYNCR